ncbi:uncharacterized protein EDB91DRAFT_1252101 [Suillus paluster]|uniref:uncharacterized protein n=1 Tax=Suillus paluster TaxID=48578 RepID=UPI001B87E093|nr:uncharacterized protein EDB91DRAFT_1252101 [Suillus paluster]KAG1731461.1 hypothetical protein EDB91DRAFT_1252101 [Suillus paluster]
MSYPYYQPNPNGSGGTNQFQFGPPPSIRFQPQPSWGGIDYFRAYAPHIDPTIFHQVYRNISGAGMGTPHVGVGINEARVCHRRAYGGLGAINALTPQEIGYASAYEAYRVWIHNTVLYASLGAEREYQREAFIGLAVAEASRMYMISRPADAYGCVPACEAAAATAWLIFDRVSIRIFDHLNNYNLTGSVGSDMYPGMGYDTGMDTGTYDSGFGTPEIAGAGMAGGTDPYAIDYEAPYFHQRMGRHRRFSNPGGTYGAGGAHSPGAEMGRGGMVGSPYLGTTAGMGMGASPVMYSGSSGGGSPLSSGNRMRATGMYGGSYPGYGDESPMYGGASLAHASPMYGSSPAYTDTRNVTTVSAYPGMATVIELPRRHHRSSSRHHHRDHHRRARSAEPVFITKAVDIPGRAGGGLAQSAMVYTGGAMGGSSGAYGPTWAGGSSGSPNMNYGYPGYGGAYRY